MGKHIHDPRSRTAASRFVGVVLVMLATVWLLGGLMYFVHEVLRNSGQLDTWLMLLPIGALGLGISWLVQGLRR